jgi:hypothetical protein
LPFEREIQPSITGLAWANSSTKMVEIAMGRSQFASQERQQSSAFSALPGASDHSAIRDCAFAANGESQAEELAPPGSQRLIRPHPGEQRGKEDPEERKCEEIVDLDHPGAASQRQDEEENAPPASQGRWAAERGGEKDSKAEQAHRPADLMAVEQEVRQDNERCAKAEAD